MDDILIVVERSETVSIIILYHTLDDDFSMIRRLKPPREALSISGNMTINNFHKLDDDSLTTLDNIVIINENNDDDSLTAFGDRSRVRECYDE
jgi:hypothetical protein